MFSVITAKKAQKIYFNWNVLVHNFTQCSLSFEQDYLVAMSGLAQDFRAVLVDVYHAGLWEKDMVKELLWYRCTSHYNDQTVRPKQYRVMTLNSSLDPS
jgi:DNA integrity scanning protein DisA with diadenylate cyclase activity